LPPTALSAGASVDHPLHILDARFACGEINEAVGIDNKVDETGSVGEASKSCGSGAGDDLDPGSIGWVTLHLAAGNYELICNLPGHYAAGMSTQLTVD
jgi:uncharacterized cupredoxin-like copper-binding protein